jgi:hypothetical protein
LRRALPSVEHFVFCHPDSSLLNTAVFCITPQLGHFRRARKNFGVKGKPFHRAAL